MTKFYREFDAPVKQERTMHIISKQYACKHKSMHYQFIWAKTSQQQNVVDPFKENRVTKVVKAKVVVINGSDDRLMKFYT